WTLALQMGVQFDRILEGFSGPFEKITAWNIKPPAGNVITADGAKGYLTSHQVNDSFIAVNRLLPVGEEVYWLERPLMTNGKNYPRGTLYVPARNTTLTRLRKIASELGVNFEATATQPTGDMLKLNKVRVGLWDRYGGSIDAGWTRWILEQFEFPYDRIFAPKLDEGNLNNRYDALIFVSGAIPPTVANAAN